MDRARIDQAVVFAPSWQGGADGTDFIDPNYEQANAAIAEGVRTHGDRLIGFARVNPKYGSKAVDELKRCFEDYGFRGLHLNNTNEWFMALHTQLTSPLLELCAERAAPVNIHTWFFPSQAYPWVAAIEAFPQVKFILAHAGYRQHPDALILAERFSNVYLETSLQLPLTVRKLIDGIGASRVLFGSNTPYSFADAEVGAMEALGLRKEDLACVLGDNAAQILGLVSASV